MISFHQFIFLEASPSSGTPPSSSKSPLTGGPPMGGLPTGGPPMGGSPMGGPPMGGSPMGGPPMGGPSMSGSPMGGPLMGGGDTTQSQNKVQKIKTLSVWEELEKILNKNNSGQREEDQIN